MKKYILSYFLILSALVSCFNDKSVSPSYPGKTSKATQSYGCGSTISYTFYSTEESTTRVTLVDFTGVATGTTIKFTGIEGDSYPSSFYLQTEAGAWLMNPTTDATGKKTITITKGSVNKYNVVIDNYSPPSDNVANNYSVKIDCTAPSGGGGTPVPCNGAASTCGTTVSQAVSGNTAYTYPTKQLDLCGINSGSTIRLTCNTTNSNVAHKFTVKTLSGTTLISSVGYYNYSFMISFKTTTDRYYNLIVERVANSSQFGSGYTAAISCN